jgi:uncharacterized protein GlcG (DUF336 family)
MDRITLEAADKLLARGIDAARTGYGRPICIAVVDDHGDLLAFARQDGAPARSIAISQGKAYSSARLGAHTDAFQERLRRDQLQASDFCDAKITSMPGGAALKNAVGAVIGALGVSGLKPEEDQAIASALAAHFVAGAI